MAHRSLVGYAIIFILLIIECVCHQGINPNPHSEIMYIANGTRLPDILEGAHFQICLLFSNQLQNRSWKTIQNPISVHVLTSISYLNLEFLLEGGMTTWVFYSKTYFPKSQGLLHKLNDQVFYYNQAGRLYEVYGLKSSVVHQEIISDSESQLRRRMNFRRVTVETVHVNKSRYFTATGSETLKVQDWGLAKARLSYELLAFMQDMLNFTVQFSNSTSWVYTASSNQPSMADLVLRSEVDLAISDTGLWKTANFRFLFITRVFSEVYVYYQPPATTSTKGFAAVVQLQVWLCFLAFAFAIFIISRYFFKEDIQSSYSWLIAVLTQRGIQEPTIEYTISSRIFIFVTSFYGLLFYISLSAILISTLSIKLEIKDLDRLLYLGYTFGVWQNSILEDGFKLGQISDKSPLYKIRASYSSYPTEQDGAQKVVTTTQFAFVSAQILYLEHKEFMESIGACKNMKVFPIKGEKIWGSAFVKTGSELADYFNFARLYMNEVGLKSHHLRIIELEEEFAKQRCHSQTPEHTNAIHLQNMTLVFEIFLVGLLLSFLIFLYEKWKLRNQG